MSVVAKALDEDSPAVHGINLALHIVETVGKVAWKEGKIYNYIEEIKVCLANIKKLCLVVLGTTRAQ